VVISGIFSVVKPPFSRQKMAAAAERLGLHLHKTQEGDGDKVAYAEMWMTEDRKNAVSYVEDPISGMTYLHFQGPNHRRIIRELPVSLYPPEEVIEKACSARKHDSRVDAIMRLAITFAAYDEDAYKIFCAYLQAEHPLLRAATLNAMAYRSWPEFNPLFEQAAQEDPDSEVRAQAARLLPVMLEAQKTGLE